MNANRPLHLLRRPIAGRAFGEDAVLLRTRGAYNEYGEWVDGDPERTPIRIATVPVSGNARGDGLIRRLEEGGIELDATRLIWSVERLYPVASNSAGDVIEWDSQEWRVRQTQRWGYFSESLVVLTRADAIAIPA